MPHTPTIFHAARRAPVPITAVEGAGEALDSTWAVEFPSTRDRRSDHRKVRCYASRTAWLLVTQLLSRCRRSASNRTGGSAEGSSTVPSNCLRSRHPRGQWSAAEEVHADRDQCESDPVVRRRPFAEDRNAQKCGRGWR